MKGGDKMKMKGEVIEICLLLLFVAVALYTIKQGIKVHSLRADSLRQGEISAYREIDQALKSGLEEGLNFYIIRDDQCKLSVMFYPRKDKGMNYRIKGSQKNR